MTRSSGKSWIQVATRYRYSFPVLAELWRDQGCKFVTLIRRLDASDRAIRQALDYLIEIGWVMRNPGYGHPARPEYILTPEGEEIGMEALTIWDQDEHGLCLSRWALTVLEIVGSGEPTFSQIKKQIPDITPRALSLTLSELVESGLLEKVIEQSAMKVSLRYRGV